MLGMENTGDYIKPEGLLNMNAGMIMLTCFLFAGFSARMKAVNSMTLGTILCSGALGSLPSRGSSRRGGTTSTRPRTDSPATC